MAKMAKVEIDVICSQCNNTCDALKIAVIASKLNDRLRYWREEAESLRDKQRFTAMHIALQMVLEFETVINVIKEETDNEQEATEET